MQNHSLAPRNLRGALLGVVAATLFSFGGACATLPDVPAGQCGNGIVDPGEECDTFASSGARCRSEDEVFACRFDCVKTADGKQPACPAGFVCGEAEGICQRPTGQFGDAAFSFEANAGHMVLGDFDGDGRKDLVASSRPDNAALTTSRVFFFDGISSAPRGVAIPTVGYIPVAADLNGDGLSDLVLGSPQGINVFLGAADRQLDPQAYGRFPLPPGSKVAAMSLHGHRANPGHLASRGTRRSARPSITSRTSGTLGGVPVRFVDPRFRSRPTVAAKVFARLHEQPVRARGTPGGRATSSSPPRAKRSSTAGRATRSCSSSRCVTRTASCSRKAPEACPNKALTLPASERRHPSRDRGGPERGRGSPRSDGNGASRGLDVAFGRGDGTFAGASGPDRRLQTTPSWRSRRLEGSCPSVLAFGRRRASPTYKNSVAR